MHYGLPMPTKKRLVPTDMPARMSLDVDPGVSIAFSTQVPDWSPWWFTAEYRPANGAGWVLSRIEVHPDPASAGGRPPVPGITSKVLRAIPLSRLPEWLGALSDSTGAPVLPAFTGAHTDDFTRRPRPGAAGRDDLHYAELAREYLNMCAASKRPIQDLANGQGVAANTVRDRLAEARRRDLLERPGKGRAGGRLTLKAKQLLGIEEGS